MLKNVIQHNQLISRRSFIIGASKMGFLGLLLARLFHMQFVKSSDYSTMSDKNRISLLVENPLRGHLYDRNGLAIATNEPCFRVVLDRVANKKYQDEIDILSKLLDLTEEDLKIIATKLKNAPPRLPVTILDELSWGQVSILEEYKHKFGAVFVDMSRKRAYPFKQVTSSFTGYMGLPAEADQEQLGSIKIRDFNIGKTGIEKYYEKSLRGDFGYKKMEVNATGRYVKEISRLASSPGADLLINIDAELQEQIYAYLNKQGASTIVMDLRDGGVVICASTPTFDANNFTKLSSSYWNDLRNDPLKPLINKTIQNYPPGSVFKIITVLAALEAGISPSKIFHCSGAPFLGGNSFRCHAKAGHGPINMFDAIKSSCNTYMYELGRIVGPDRIIDVARRFGFGQKTGVDLPGEMSGFLPSRDWKRSKLKTDWTLGDTLNLVIGQGFLLATPFQMCKFVSAIASDGKMITPRIAKSNMIYENIDIDPEHLSVVRMAMYNAVNTQGGTGYHSRVISDRFKVAGKTGTVQVQAKSHAGHDLSSEKVAWASRNHAVFMGFGPYDDPVYAALSFVDHGGGGGRAAAPVANRILSELFKKYL